MNKQNYSLNYFAYIIMVVVIFVLPSCTQKATTKNRSSHHHPCLLLSASGISALKRHRDNLLIKNAIQKIQTQVDQAILFGIKVPVPKDAGGGYTHEQHKKNGILLYESGLLYQITGDTKYADFAKTMFLKYAAMYPTLGLHPKRKKQSPGKLFWQALNENVWLVYAIQGYDFFYNYLSLSDRKKIENGLFLPMANFLSVGSPHMFDRIHNHATWAVTAVGMTGYVLGKKDLVEKSLYGLHKDGKGGFYAQINQLFSPDGYYAEGPYYQRYAMMPFLTFADVIDKNEPSRKLFAYRDSVLLKAVGALLQMTDVKGAFFPFNDALKEKTFLSPEVIFAVDIAYAHGGKNPEFLDVAKKQHMVTLTDEGITTAIDRGKELAKPFQRHSIFLSDGPQGKKGGLGILRYGPSRDQTCLILKATSHGMGHGHYDELNLLMYDQGGELIRDYGSVRYLNIEAKSGGRYLPENSTWAKQSIAHNTITVDQTCQYQGNLKSASLPTHHPVFLSFDDNDTVFQYMSALDTTAYPGTSIRRTMILSKLPGLKYPVSIDVIKIRSDKNHLYDLPFYYKGKIIETNFSKTVFTKELKPLGKKNGYQYLWLTGYGTPRPGIAQITWLKKHRFYTLTSLSDNNTKILFTMTGANDPGFSLRNESGIILRQNHSENHLFINIIEPHGVFNPTDEYTINSYSQLSNIKVLENDNRFIRFQIILKNGTNWEFQIPDSFLNSKDKNYTYKQIK